jgi:hypothetical protein
MRHELTRFQSENGELPDTLAVASISPSGCLKCFLAPPHKPLHHMLLWLQVGCCCTCHQLTLHTKSPRLLDPRCVDVWYRPPWTSTEALLPCCLLHCSNAPHCHIVAVCRLWRPQCTAQLALGLARPQGHSPLPTRQWPSTALLAQGLRRTLRPCRLDTHPRSTVEHPCLSSPRWALQF